VTYYNAQKEKVWTMEGRVCPSPAEEGGEPCVGGLQVQADGKILIGSQPIHHVTVYALRKGDMPPLTPWPFVEMPKVKVWRK
jgi:hypothetical protein